MSQDTIRERSDAVECHARLGRGIQLQLHYSDLAVRAGRRGDLKALRLFTTFSVSAGRYARSGKQGV